MIRAYIKGHLGCPKIPLRPVTMAPPAPVSSPETRTWSLPAKPIPEMAGIPREEQLRQILADARRRAAERDYAPGTIIGRVQDFSREELASLQAKFVTRGGYLFLTECDTEVHTRVAQEIVRAIVESLNRAIRPGMSHRYSFQAAWEVPDRYRRLYRCTDPALKIFDFAARLDAELEADPVPPAQYPICGEVRFRGEEFPDLLAEGEEMASAYSNTLFAVLAFTRENPTGTGVEYIRLIVLGKRETPEETAEVAAGRREGPPCRKDYKKPFAGISERRVSSQDLAAALHAVVLYDERHTLPEMRDLATPKGFRLQAEALNRFLQVGDLLHADGDDLGTIRIALERALWRVARSIDAMTQGGTYPHHAPRRL